MCRLLGGVEEFGLCLPLSFLDQGMGIKESKIWKSENPK